jgi:hypothetical protein
MVQSLQHNMAWVGTVKGDSPNLSEFELEDVLEFLKRHSQPN